MGATHRPLTAFDSASGVVFFFVSLLSTLSLQRRLVFLFVLGVARALEAVINDPGHVLPGLTLPTASFLCFAFSFSFVLFLYFSALLPGGHLFRLVVLKRFEIAITPPRNLGCHLYSTAIANRSGTLPKKKTKQATTKKLEVKESGFGDVDAAIGKAGDDKCRGKR